MNAFNLLTSTKNYVGLTFVFFLLGLVACNNQKSETPAASPSPSPATYTSPTYTPSPYTSPYTSTSPYGSTTTVQPTYASLNTVLFQPYCASCHNSTTRSGNFDISTYYGLMTKVIARDPYNSAVLKTIQAPTAGSTTVPHMPPVSTGKIVPQEYQTALSQWIQNGALQN